MITLDIVTITQIIITAIGGATILFRILEPIAEMTQNSWDDNFVQKCLKIVTKLAEIISLNKDNDKLTIKLK